MSRAGAQSQQFEVVRYRKPTLKSLGRGLVLLAKTGLIETGIHIVKPGTPQGLHAHDSYDQFYFVLSGRVRFIGAGDAGAELGPLEGISVPRSIPYGFEAIGEEAELLFFNARTPGVADRFISHHAGSDRVELEIFAPDGASRGIYRDG